MVESENQRDAALRNERVERAVKLLDEVLAIVDGLDDCPQIGARLSEARYELAELAR